MAVDFFKTYSDIGIKYLRTMVPIHEVSNGNWLQVSLDGQLLTGKVLRKSVERIGVEAEGELGWYFPTDVYSIPLTEDWLMFFDFKKSTDPSLDGVAKAYEHGPFVLHFPDKNDESHSILTCHSSHDKEFHHKMDVHEFQNHYHEMTKVFIE